MSTKLNGSADPNKLATPRILLIDDDPMVRDTVHRVMRWHGFEVVVAQDGVRGMEALWQYNPVLVLTDIIMPHKQGISVLAEIKRERPDVKVVVISGGGGIGNTDCLDMAAKLGADATIAKPFDGDELLEILDRLLRASTI